MKIVSATTNREGDERVVFLAPFVPLVVSTKLLCSSTRANNDSRVILERPDGGVWNLALREVHEPKYLRRILLKWAAGRGRELRASVKDASVSTPTTLGRFFRRDHFVYSEYSNTQLEERIQGHCCILILASTEYESQSMMRHETTRDFLAYVGLLFRRGWEECKVVFRLFRRSGFVRARGYSHESA